MLILVFLLQFVYSLSNTCSNTNSPTSSLRVCSLPEPKIVLENKEQKFNYASLDCGARILASNQGAREIGSILVNAKDKYMVNTCSTKDKFIELEFCQEILVESVVLANYELFSSVFKDIRIYVNHIYPASFKYSWKLIGSFTAQNIKGKQIFNVKNPILWAKYLRIEFLSHYGDEYYCPFSQIKVFGTTMMEEVKAEENKPLSNEDDFMKIIQEQVSKDSMKLEDDIVQESFFKNLMKRLSALEESAVFTNNFLKKQRREVKLFLERLETEQMTVLLDFLNNEWIKFADDNCNSDLQSFILQVDDYRRVIGKKLKKLDETVDQMKQEMFYYNLFWQIPLAIFLFYARSLITDQHQIQQIPIQDGKAHSNTSVQTSRIKKRKRKVHFNGRLRSNTS